MSPGVRKSLVIAIIVLPPFWSFAMVMPMVMTANVGVFHNPGFMDDRGALIHGPGFGAGFSCCASGDIAANYCADQGSDCRCHDLAVAFSDF